MEIENREAMRAVVNASKIKAVEDEVASLFAKIKTLAASGHTELSVDSVFLDTVVYFRSKGYTVQGRAAGESYYDHVVIYWN